ncbi:hypothetical protein OPV22_000792 [Ensete ventricosum]|uniref:Uncharacterized protein n=1 Tax=Ensete ventricosum TaxID=4639 RepID=A0AAV8RVP7_ENSVE|nr:hypothetical protein OPV22_000792 [Ensete ventricosum]
MAVQLWMGHHVHGSILQSWAFAALGVNLWELRLGWSGLKEDPLPALCLHHNLSVLYVPKSYDGEQLCFSTDWFPKLQEPHLLHLPHLKRIIIEKGRSEKHIPKVLDKIQIDGTKTIEVLSWPNGTTHPALSQDHENYVSSLEEANPQLNFEELNLHSNLQEPILQTTLCCCQQLPLQEPRLGKRHINSLES